MNISFYTASAGAQQQQERLDIHANNIANVNNYGFRARIPSFSALMTGPITGIDEDLPRGVGSRIESAETDLRPSALTGTGRALDFAIEGSGFFALVDPEDGEYYYTRDGSFTLSDILTQTEAGKEWESQEVRQWHLSDGNGRLVLGRDGRPVQVELTPQTDLLEVDFNVGVFGFINYNGMESNSENRISQVEKNGQVGLLDAKVVQGYLEMSNTDLAHELSKVIESQRSFQYMLRMVTTSDEIETTVNNLR